MKIIKVLPEGLIDRIAAGEVIENPASVIKELLENSLDASAANIEISVMAGGKEEILIVDDGEGIANDMVEIAFMRHATSKIRSFDDLLRTSTMGFRGEALPSISSVSIMELSTCTREEKIGTRIRFEGGKQTHLGPAPPRFGCSISVRNLFYNVPARRKFLKSDSSEKRKISEVLRRYFIARPEIGFKMNFDGRGGGSFAPADDLHKRLREIWGGNIADKLLPILQEPTGPLHIYGFLSSPDTIRANRSEIFFFVNKRPVVEKAMYGAIIAAYENTLPRGQYPYAAVFMDIDPGFVDINVHPAKIEVRFSDSGFIFTTLKNAMKNALRLPIGLTVDKSIGYRDKQETKTKKAVQESFETRTEIREGAISSGKIQGNTRSEVEKKTASQEIDHAFQIFDTYIVSRKGDEVVILDQHTAHERILFERTLNSLNSRPSSSQKLLFEARVKLTPMETSLVEELSEFLEKAGFEIRPFGDNEVILSGTPQELSGASPESALKEILSEFSRYRDSGDDIRRALAAAVACKAAVKAGQRLTDVQIRGLYSDLMRCDEPFRCPHGRPTMAVLNRHDLEKIFQRK